MNSVASRAARGVIGRLGPTHRIWPQCPDPRRRAIPTSALPKLRLSSTTNQIDPTEVLARPTWSVRSLLPNGRDAHSEDARITPKQLYHLLRLSALPLPKTAEEEAEMIDVLQSQLSFVRDIQGVDTRGVEPLRSIRDETEAGLKEATINVDKLRHVLSQEVAHGRSKRPRRQKNSERAPPEVEGWDPLQTASQTTGPYFIVWSGKNKPQ